MFVYLYLLTKDSSISINILSNNLVFYMSVYIVYIYGCIKVSSIKNYINVYYIFILSKFVQNYHCATLILQELG